MPDRLAGVDLEPDQLPLRACLPADQRIAADEIVVLRLERHGKADAGLERVGLVAELVIGEDQPRFDAQHVERLQAERDEAMRLAGLPDRVENGFAILRDGRKSRSRARPYSRCARPRRAGRHRRRCGRSKSGTIAARQGSAAPAASRSRPSGCRGFSAPARRCCGAGRSSCAPRRNSPASRQARAARRRHIRRRRSSGNCSGRGGTASRRPACRHARSTWPSRRPARRRAFARCG